MNSIAIWNIAAQRGVVLLVEYQKESRHAS